MSLSLNTLTYHVYTTITAVIGEVPTPGEMKAPEKVGPLVQKIMGFLGWIGTAAGVVGIIVTGAAMAISHKRGESSEHVSRLGMVLGGCILIATAGPIVNFVFSGN
jgi:type IV secretory pathway VirB2 component (pilin)